ncbi:hypothetical protein [Tenacibaculum maritimum]|uniref:hypothetical protein n=1 Tax=Tenacibaculum maritimum TaxID=107401 RepID=UPI000413A045|nr:hypothetical protein [Tenacibaculum maritimum]MCD9581459.1 hypothetical protein [Tenacibaculum maritimum]MCD9611097.1 hypothetical protein [Tenacibaculum maritimum]MCD9635773.1 hypothetical protein [Tenacibaculum maritimum]
MDLKHIYHYVCFNCRKTFKQLTFEAIIVKNSDWDVYKKTYLNYDAEKAVKFKADHPMRIARFEQRYLNKKI